MQELRQADEKTQQKFIARGLRSRDGARQSGKYVGADAVRGRLEKLLSNEKRLYP